MDWSVRSMTCRHGACCASALNWPWWYSAEEIKVFKGELDLELQRRELLCGAGAGAVTITCSLICHCQIEQMSK